MNDSEAIAAIRARRAKIDNNWHLRTRHASSTKELCADADGSWHSLVEIERDGDGDYVAWSSRANLDFAVHAPADIDTLLASVDALTAQLAAVTAERDALRAAFVERGGPDEVSE